MFNLLKNTFQNTGISLPDDKIGLLEQFYSYLVEYNTHTNLTRITSPEEASLKHFADSLQGIPFIPENAKVCDIGSGGGFPAIPLSVALPSSSFTLVDSTGKKVDFLNSAIQKLGLTNTRALHYRAEEMAQNADFREQFDVVTARAVASLPTLLEYCLPFVKVGGYFLSYKTSEEEINEASSALSTLGGILESVRPYTLGDLGEKRVIFVIKKVSSTPPKYPRGQGKPRSKPL